jgi:hypothetical protein
MKGKKYASTGNNNLDPALLEELFPSSDDSKLLNFDSLGLDALGRIIAYTTALGGTCTFYKRDADNVACLSLRIGERKRSLELANDDVDSTFLDQLANGVARIYLAKLQLKEAEKLAAEAKGSKQKGK